MAAGSPTPPSAAARAPARAPDARASHLGAGLAVAALVLLLDQASKWWVARTFGLGDGVALGPWLNLVRVENPGAAFSFLAAASGWQRWLFMGFGLIASAVMIALLARPQRMLIVVVLGLVLGGALGNVVDRVIWGHVTDFIDVHLGGYHWPAFNIADSALTIGVGLMLLNEWIRPKPRD